MAVNLHFYAYRVDYKNALGTLLPAFRPLLMVLAADDVAELAHLVTLAAFDAIVILTLRTDSDFSLVHAHLTPSCRPTCATSDHFS